MVQAEESKIHNSCDESGTSVAQRCNSTSEPQSKVQIFLARLQFFHLKCVKCSSDSKYTTFKLIQ